jgi:hypothetical protein
MPLKSSHLSHALTLSLSAFLVFPAFPEQYFISAEGAYSTLVFGSRGISVKIFGRGMDDFSRSPVVRLASGGMYRCDSVLSKAARDRASRTADEAGRLSACLGVLGVVSGPGADPNIVAGPESSVGPGTYNESDRNGTTSALVSRNVSAVEAELERGVWAMSPMKVCVHL